MSDKIALEFALRHKNPFYVVNLGTTGFDNAKASDNYPTRLYITGYEYNADTREYEAVHKFEECVLIPDGTLARIESDIAAGKFNPFENGGMTIDDWKAAALSQEDFCKKLDAFMGSVPKDALMLANFDSKGFYKYVRKDYGSPLKDFGVDIVSTTSVAKEIYGQTMKLDDIAAKVAPELLVNGKLENADTRMQATFRFMTSFGLDAKLLAGNFEKAVDQQAKQRSEKARAEYEQKKISDKVDSLKEMGVVSSSTPQLDKLTSILSCEKGNKGFTVLVVATTGLNADDRPIQLCAVTFGINGQDAEPLMSMSFDVQADKRYVDIAMNSSFDAFAYTGLDKEKYLKGDGVKSEEDTISIVMQYFGKYSLKDYPLVSNGTSKTGIAYAMNALSKIGNFPQSLINTDFVDFTQVIKEHITKYKDESVLLGDDKNIKNFSLNSIAASRGMNLENSTTNDKVSATALLIGDIFNEMYGISKEAVAKEVERENMESTYSDILGAIGNLMSSTPQETRFEDAEDYQDFEEEFEPTEEDLMEMEAYQDTGVYSRHPEGSIDEDYEEDEDYDYEEDEEYEEETEDELFVEKGSESEKTTTVSSPASPNLSNSNTNNKDSYEAGIIAALGEITKTLQAQNELIERQTLMLMGLMDIQSDMIMGNNDVAMLKMEKLRRVIDSKGLD